MQVEAMWHRIMVIWLTPRSLPNTVGRRGKPSYNTICGSKTLEPERIALQRVWRRYHVG